MFIFPIVTRNLRQFLASIRKDIRRAIRFRYAEHMRRIEDEMAMAKFEAAGQAIGLALDQGAITQRFAKSMAFEQGDN